MSYCGTGVCSSDLEQHLQEIGRAGIGGRAKVGDGLDLLLAVARAARDDGAAEATRGTVQHPAAGRQVVGKAVVHDVAGAKAGGEQRPLQAPETGRSEEHTSELQSLMRISYAVFCLKKKK